MPLWDESELDNQGAFSRSEESIRAFVRP